MVIEARKALNGEKFAPILVSARQRVRSDAASAMELLESSAYINGHKLRANLWV